MSNFLFSYFAFSEKKELSCCGFRGEIVACVAGAKRGGGGGGGIEKGKKERSPLSLQSSYPFSLPPYPLPLSKPAT